MTLKLRSLPRSIVRRLLRWLAGGDVGTPLHLRAIAGDLRVGLFSYINDPRIDPVQFGLGPACDWLADTVAKLPSDTELQALSASALRSWVGPSWRDATGGAEIYDELRRYFAVGNEIRPADAWAAALVLQTLEGAYEDREFCSVLAERLTFLAESNLLDTAARAQLAVALLRAGPSDVHAGTRDLVTNDLEHEDPYVTAQVVWAATQCGDTADLAIDTWELLLARWLDGRPLNRANTATVSACLRALALSPKVGVTTEVRVHTERLLSTGRRPNGSWHESPWETAWALLAAHSAHQVRHLQLSVAEGAELVAHLGDRLAESERFLIAQAEAIRVRQIPELFGWAFILGLVVAIVFYTFLAEGFSTTLGLLGAGVTAILYLITRRVVVLHRSLRLF